MSSSFDIRAIRNLSEDAGDFLSGIGNDTRQDRAGTEDAARLLTRSGLSDVEGLDALARRLPGDLGGPDATGEVPTGSAAITRAEAETAARLAAAARVVEALGPGTLTVEVPGESFAMVERYEDLTSGFSAVRLRPADGGPEVFAVDGLEVGSRADEVSAAGLGRLQVESEAFRAMIEDAQATALVEGRVASFTGPSLGGAVAQVAAYETAEGLLGRGFATGAVELVTVDALGGRDAAEAINGGVLDADALGLIEALNLRTEGDIVSRIGSHIGATLTLPAVDAEGDPVVLDAASAHVNVESLLEVLTRDDLFAQGRPGAPAEVSAFAAAANGAGWALGQVWRATGGGDDGVPDALQIPGVARFDETGTRWSLDADGDGRVDLAATLSAPADAATRDLVLG